ncbi:MAG: hypothetical protein AAFR42_06455 [Cyanobacteria bacterium J06628_6]
MNRLHLTGALLSTATVLATAPAALAQSADQNYISDLYNFLGSQDELAYVVAAEYIGADMNVYLAQSFCQAYREGVSPADAFSYFTTYAISEAANSGYALGDAEAYTLGLYAGSVMNLGAAYYCPEYSAQVEQALNAM